MTKDSKGGATTPPWETVAMDAVPDPPLSTRTKWRSLYTKVKALGLDENHAIKVEFRGVKQFIAARTGLRKCADLENLKLCTSRNEDSTEGYFWLVKAK